jgi:hypothetical protein
MDTLLSLSPHEFDQTENGWRNLPALEAAELIEKYLELNSDKFPEIGSPTIYTVRFHAGQCFASAGEEYYSKAVYWMRGAIGKNSPLWDPYVRGSIAFLERDTEALKHEITIYKKYIEAENEEIQKHWIINLNILQRFLKGLESGNYSYNNLY